MSHPALHRALDVVGASALLLAAAPVLAPLALLVRVVDGPPVLFRQERAGRGGVPFTILKLRTMRPAGPTGQGDEKDDGDDDADARTTRLGTWLRATSLDEVPQLWNVLRGEMALVGPRPLYRSYVPLYSAVQARRLLVRPGLTGLAQISGRHELSWSEKLALDVAYVERRSLALDLRVLVRTVPCVLGRRGVRTAGHETWFTGEPALTAGAGGRP